MVISSPKDFFGKKVLVMGLGLHGGGVAAAYWLFRHGAEVIVTDLKSRDELESSIIRLTSLCNEYRLAHPDRHLHSIEYILGKHRMEDFQEASCIIRNPGVPRESPYLACAQKNSIPIHNDASILFSLVPSSMIIGVTGTRGKTTTTTLIWEMLKKTYPKVLLAGIATPDGAISFFSIIDRALEALRTNDFSPIVLELSSWQLEMLESYRMSPHCAVVTNVYPDHLNRYRSFDDYVHAKKALYYFQKKDDGDMSVFNYDNRVTRSMGREAEKTSERYWFSRKKDTLKGVYSMKNIQSKQYVLMFSDEKVTAPLCSLDTLSLLGEHNEENALAASTVAALYHVPREHICDVLAHTRGVSGRLEYLGTRQGRLVYNDTTATSPDAVIAAIRALSGRSRRIILIAGGSDKNLNFKELGTLIAKRVKALVLLSGSASPHIASSAGAAGFGGRMLFANSMMEAVQKAWSLSQDHDILLLSPGAASFGMFVHEFDRGVQFVDAIHALCPDGEQ